MKEDGQWTYDVFVSYNADDRSWVRSELVPRLEQSGFTVCVDYRDFKPGESALNEIERGLHVSRKTVLVLTPEYVATSWVGFERLSSQSQGQETFGQDMRLVPLIKEKSNIPPALQDLAPIDLAVPDPDAKTRAWNQLLVALGNPTPPPQEVYDLPVRDGWLLEYPHALPLTFVPRVTEQAMLSLWLQSDANPLLLLHAPGGGGKSALVWHWLLHDVSPTRWGKVVWWGFSAGNSRFEAFLEKVLVYLDVDTQQMSTRQQADEVLHVLGTISMLVVLDGFEHAFCGFGQQVGAVQQDQDQDQDQDCACLSTVTDYFLRSIGSQTNTPGKVVLTSQVCPQILRDGAGGLLPGCHQAELPPMQPAEAMHMLYALGIRGDDEYIRHACVCYGCHPLHLRLLAGFIISDAHQPGNIAVFQQMYASNTQTQRHHDIVEQMYRSLSPTRQKLLHYVACFRLPVRYEALEKLTRLAKARYREKVQKEAQKTVFRQVRASITRMLSSLGVASGERRALEEYTPDLNNDLHDLVARGLLHYNRYSNRYELHSMVRIYAYQQMDDQARSEAHDLLREYFVTVRSLRQVQSLVDLEMVLLLYYHTILAGLYDEAFELLHEHIYKALYYRFGAYHLLIELLHALFPDGEEHLPRLGNESYQAWVLNSLANSYGLSGQPHRAVTLLKQATGITEQQGDSKNLAIDLGNLAYQQMAIGELQVAEENLRRSIQLYQQSGDDFSEADGHLELGRLLSYRGAWDEAEQALTTAQGIFEKWHQVNWQSIVWSYRTLCLLLHMRLLVATGNIDDRKRMQQEALRSARRALELVQAFSEDHSPVEQDYVRAYWLLGAACRGYGRLDEADGNLREALNRCRRVNKVEVEATILLEMAMVWQARQESAQAYEVAQAAFAVANCGGYVLQCADICCFLAQLALSEGDNDMARGYAIKAKEYATCDGAPSYTYASAYTEAEAMLTHGA